MDVVYCVQIIHEDGSKGPIKIGLSNRHGVKARLRTLQAGVYEDLVLIGIVRGDFNYEVAIQRSLEEQRIRGEWYAWSDKTERIILPIFACTRGKKQATPKTRREKEKLMEEGTER